MKKSAYLTFGLLSCLFLISSCQGASSSSLASSSSEPASSSNSSTPESSSSSESSSSAASSASSSSSSEAPVEYSSISDVYSGQDEDSFSVKGVVAQFTYGYDGPECFYVCDSTGSILVYPGDYSIESIAIGNTVSITGTRDHYQSNTDAAVGSEIGYYGALQLVASSEISVLDSGVSEIPEGAITDSRIKTLSETDFRDEDLTSRLFRVPATIVKAASTGYTNYYFYDLSMDQSIYCYSKTSGADYSYLDEYDNTSHEVIIAVHSMRPRDEAWRIVPISIGDVVTPSDADIAGFALDRLEDQFLDSYSESVRVDLLKQDSKLLAESSVSYSSSSSNSLILEDEVGTYLSIDSASEETFEVTISLLYKEVTYTRKVSITVAKAPEYETITIAETLAAEEGSEVYVSGIYIKFTTNYSGVYLVDSTGILAVYYQSLEISDYKEGELMVFKGTVTRDFQIDGAYDGYNRLASAELLSHDGLVHEWDTSIVSGTNTCANLYSNFAISDIGKIYKINGYVQQNSTTYYTNYRLYDADGSSYLTLYSANGSQLSWLSEHVGTTQDYYVYVRDSKNGSYGRYEIVGIAA